MLRKLYSSREREREREREDTHQRTTPHHTYQRLQCSAESTAALERKHVRGRARQRVNEGRERERTEKTTCTSWSRRDIRSGGCREANI